MKQMVAESGLLSGVATTIGVSTKLDQLHQLVGDLSQKLDQHSQTLLDATAKATAQLAQQMKEDKDEIVAQVCKNTHRQVSQASRCD